MSIKLRKLLLASALLPIATWAQNVDRSKYPDYSAQRNPDPQLMQPRKAKGKAQAVRPDHVNNAESRYFPPVFYQAGGSCGSASRICYMFSHELNSFRDLDGKDPKNYYPSHFVWLLTNGNSGKDAFIQYVGVPSAATYGGQTYSKLFGSQDTNQQDFGWMSGYDKWYEAMFNRMLKPTHFTKNVGTEEGREAVKNYLWNHNGDPDFHSGGIVGIGCSSRAMDFKEIKDTPANRDAGVAGKKYLIQWGPITDHAMTIVGYDDRIEFDLNGNGICGEASADERGAWIVMNSWGADWQNDGAVYVPYAYAGPTFTNGRFSGDWWTPEVYNVRKNYRPLRTIKIKMDYSHRSELYLMAGVSQDINATSPQYTQAFDHFKYAGDGNYGNTDPAPAVPMQGRWVDGKLHNEPMEFGYDLTDLSDNLDPNESMKYFFIIETKKSAIGNGHIYNASILDYEQDAEGLEFPFAIGKDGVTVENQGNRTIISVVVPGRGVKSPSNVTIDNGKLVWSAPVATVYTLTGYKVYKGTEEIATLDAKATSYALPEDAKGTYAVQAIYGKKVSGKINATVPEDKVSNTCLRLTHSGFTIPGVFSSKYDKATIEYWIRPMSLTNWNQSAGPGWGTFMFHANANGSLTAGWGLEDRSEAAGALQLNKWKHVAIVVDGNMMTTYINGVKSTSFTSQKFSGLGGFGDLTFSSNGNSNDQHAYYQDIRIWKTARTAQEIKDNYNRQFADALLPEDLIAYYRGDLINVDGKEMMRDHTVGAHHATLANSKYTNAGAYSQDLAYESNTQISIVQPEEVVMVGRPTTFHAQGSTNIASLHWTAAGAGIKDLRATSPILTFNKSGEQAISVVATDINGKTVTANTTIKVIESTAPKATFTLSREQLGTGDRITFTPTEIVDGCRYKWSMPGASKTSSTNTCVAVSYANSGSYDVTLTVTDMQGHSQSSTQTIYVSTKAPKAAFDVNPAVVMKGETVTLSNRSLYHAKKCQWTIVSPQTAMQGEGFDVSFTPTVSGIYDVTLKASNSAGSDEATQNHALVVCNADSKTGLSFSPAATARLTSTKVPFTEGQNYFTMEWWMRANALTAKCNGIGESPSTFQIQTEPTGQMVVYIKGKSAKSVEGYVIPNEWHHYAVTYYMGMVIFYRDGQMINRGGMNANALPALKTFCFGSDDAPMCGTIDEFRVWDKDLEVGTIRGYITEPMDAAKVNAAEAEGLKLYYQFNQNGGNVTDATSNQNTGVRSGFGPDGDAFADSKGVFALNFGSGATDVTSNYLKNTKEPFENTGKMFSDAYQGRFMTLKDWKLENINVSKYNTGAHVDVVNGSDFTIRTGDLGFEADLENHKVYQTIDLPAGAYMFSAHYGNYEGDADGCYLVVGNGNSLPDTKDISKAFAYKAMESKSNASQNDLFFVLTEPATISLGILANLAGQQCLSVKSFTLTQYPLSKMEGLVDTINGATIDTPASINAHPIYDLSGRRVNIPGKGIYIIGGKKVVR